MLNNDFVPGFDDEKDKSLNITLQSAESLDKGLYVVLTGSIDSYNSSFFQKKVNSIIEAGFVNLIVNCAALNYVSSNGIGCFTNFLSTLKSHGGDMVLISIQPKVYEVFSLLGFSQFFTIKNTIDEAVKHFSNSDDGTNSLFPVTFSCPMCQRTLKAPRAGKFRCSGCKIVIVVSEKGTIDVDLS
ncbi:MAG: STAS domain-containing protein [Treponema sp.]|nr:STAS domain-containing protein [Treponema sp.]